MLGIIGAMDEEVVKVKEQMENVQIMTKAAMEFFEGTVNSHPVVVVRSGIGKVNAAMNLTALLANENIDLIFMTGSAGSMQNDIHQKDLILPNAFSYHDAHNTRAGNYVEGQIPQEPAQFELNSPARQEFLNYLTANNIDFKEGLIVTGDSFIASNKQKEAIKKNFPNALGVEMEGAAFAQVASKFNVPLVALRAISDNGDEGADEDFDTFVKEVGQKAATIISSYLEKEVLN